MKSVFLLDEVMYHRIYSDEQIAKINALTEPACGLIRPAEWREHKEELRDVEILFSGWGYEPLYEELLDAMPKLKMVFYGAGSIKKFATPESWKRGIRIMSAWMANDVPVCEYTVSQVIWCLKFGYRFTNEYKAARRDVDRLRYLPGSYNSTVGIVSLGAIGRMVAKRLSTYDLNLVAYDPFVSEETAAELGVRLVSLDELFRISDCVTLHTPWLPETEKLITGELIASMKQDSTFINTSRGAVVDEEAMIDVLEKRPDIQAVLDVTYPYEPPLPESKLWDLPNVVLTPHIAGSLSGECHRNAAYVIEDLERYLAGEKLKYEVTEEMAKRMA